MSPLSTTLDLSVKMVSINITEKYLIFFMKSYENLQLRSERTREIEREKERVFSSFGSLEFSHRYYTSP